MQERTLARRYAKGLFEAAREAKQLEAVEQEMGLLGAALGRREAVRFFNNPTLDFEVKLRALQDSLGRTCSEPVVQLLQLMCERRRMGAFAFAAEIFAELSDEHRGLRRVKVRLAAPVSEAEMARLSERLSRLLQKRVVVDTEVDEKLLGGAQIVVDDTILDGSVRGAIDRLHERMKG